MIAFEAVYAERLIQLRIVKSVVLISFDDESVRRSIMGHCDGRETAQPFGFYIYVVVVDDLNVEFLPLIND